MKNNLSPQNIGDSEQIQLIKQTIADSIATKEILLHNEQIIATTNAVVEEIVNTYSVHSGKVIIAGNGGSAADAQHMAAEFVGRFYFDRKALPSIAITTDSSILTAIGNDYGYDYIFLRQLEAHAKKHDVYIAISTSGNSSNIVASVKKCKELGLVTVGLTGMNVGQMDEYCDYILKVPSTDTPRIQEAHLLLEHIICDLVEQRLFTKQVG